MTTKNATRVRIGGQGRVNGGLAAGARWLWSCGVGSVVVIVLLACLREVGVGDQ